MRIYAYLCAYMHICAHVAEFFLIIRWAGGTGPKCPPTPRATHYLIYGFPISAVILSVRKLPAEVPPPPAPSAHPLMIYSHHLMRKVDCNTPPPPPPFPLTTKLFKKNLVTFLGTDLRSKVHHTVPSVWRGSRLRHHHASWEGVERAREHWVEDLAGGRRSGN